MYTTLLLLHSLLRWLVLASLLFAVYRSARGWLAAAAFTPLDNTVRAVTTISAHIQLLVGVVLYFISPITTHFLQHFKEAVKDGGIRFFGMEHSIMMLLAIALITIGSLSAKRKSSDKAKFKTMAIWFAVALLITLAATPWPFTAMAARPLFRLF